MDENRELLRQYHHDIDLVELRVDLLQDQEVQRLRKAPEAIARDLPGVKRILTCRREQDGGAWTLSEAARISLLNDLLKAQFDYVDIESDVDDATVCSLVSSSIRAIRSIHELETMPDDPASLLEVLSRGHAIAKLAVAVHSSADAADLVEAALSRPSGSHVTLGMGEYGIVTRLLAHRIGSAWTYSSGSNATSAAPGQVDPWSLVNRFGYRRLTMNSGVYAVVGDPVSHSKSPDYHNSRFVRDNLDAVYVMCPANDMSSFFRIARAVGICGASVTVPHKAAAAQMADQVDDTVRQTGACNTLIRDGDMYLGTNTDIPGFLEPLEPGLERLKSATVIGAGGAARAVTYALVARGIDVLIVNRTESHAHALAESLNRSVSNRSSRQEGPRAGKATAAGLPEDRSALSGYRGLIVQTTSCGMTPDVDADPIPSYRFDGSEIVYDIIYSPEITTLLRRAEAAGCTVISGLRMFEAQAAAQYELFRDAYWASRRQTGSDVPKYDGFNREADAAPWSAG